MMLNKSIVRAVNSVRYDVIFVIYAKGSIFETKHSKRARYLHTM